MEPLLVVALSLGIVAAVLVVTRGVLPTRQDAPGSTNGASDIADIVRRLDTLEHRGKLLRTEWEDYHSRLDTLIRRGIRMRIVEKQAGNGEEAPEQPMAAPAPTTRAEVLKQWAQKQRKEK